MISPRPHFSAWMGIVAERTLDRRQAAHGRHQPGGRRAVAAVVRSRRDLVIKAVSGGREQAGLALVAETAGTQPRKLVAVGWQQNGPHRWAMMKSGEVYRRQVAA